MYADPQIFRSIVVPRRNYSLKKIQKYLDEERERFETYNRQNGKTITDPSSMFLRWLARAREFATENVTSRAYPAYDPDDPARFLTGRYQQFVMR